MSLHRSRRGPLRLAAGALAVALCGVTAKGDTPVDGAADRMALPEAVRTVGSPTGAFEIRIEAIDGWSTLASRATLWRVRGTRRRALWTRRLPHAIGPRYALVDDAGHTLLVDEWTHVRSALALMVLDAHGRTVARYSFDELRDRVRIPERVLVREAVLGWWVSRPPRLQPGDAVAHVGIADVTLAIGLRDGRLDVRGESRFARN